jgi:predicted phage tail protein
VGSSANYAATDGTDLAFVQLTWTNPSDANRAYADVLYRRAGNPDYIIADQTSATVARVDDLTPGVAYDYAVRAVSRFGVPSALNTLNNQTAPSDTTAPATPSGLTAAVGTGRTAALDWNDNAETDFSYYEIYRNTSNAFGTAAKLGNALTSRFTDVVSDFETSYFYWVRAADRSGNLSPVHPGSTAGVTIASSRLVTTDISSNAIGQIIGFSNVDPILNIGAAETAVATISAAFLGGTNILHGKARLIGVAGDEKTLRIRVNSTGGTLLDSSAGGTEATEIRICLATHSPGSATVVYVLTAQYASGASNDTSQRQFAIVETRR